MYVKSMKIVFSVIAVISFFAALFLCIIKEWFLAVAVAYVFLSCIYNARYIDRKKEKIEESKQSRTIRHTAGFCSVFLSMVNLILTISLAISGNFYKSLLAALLFINFIDITAKNVEAEKEAVE